MDIGSAIGLVIAWAFVIMALATGAGIGVYIDVQSFMIVIMGTIGIVVASMPLN